MAEITAALVKELREKTGAGMMDCKKALAETQGDLEGAFDWLRKKGLAAAAKKAGRVAAEGLVGLAVEGTRGALVEVNAETDFVARNEQFQGFVRQVAQQALDASDIEGLAAAPYGKDGKSVAETLTQLIATIGENMTLRRMAKLSVGRGVVVGYVHNSQAPGLGKIGVLVGLKSTADKGRLSALAKQLAMHVAAASPLAISVEHLSPEVVARERNVQAEIARQSGRPENVIEKMMEGRMRKFYEETVLLQQTFVIDGETQVGKVIEKAAKELGAAVTVEGFVRFQVGEGIEKAEADFADEVAQMAGTR